MKKIKVVIIDGSPRKQSETRKLAYLTSAELELAGAEVLVIDQGLAPLPFFDGDEESAKHTSVQNLFLSVAAADAIVLSSPEYHGSMSAALKNALDWLTFQPRTEVFSNKVIGLIGGGGGFANSGANLQMMMAVRNMHGWLMPDVMVSVPAIWNAFNDAGQLLDQNLKQRLTEFCKKLTENAAMFRNKRAPQISDKAA